MKVHQYKGIILDLFAGTRSVSSAFEKRGWKTYSVEWDKSFDNIDLYADIGTLSAEDIIELCGGQKPDVIWASPDCSSYSVSAISKHRKKNETTGELDPISEYAKFCDKVNAHVITLIKELNPKYFFIENPVGGLRKMQFMQGIPRYTVTYCQYGERRQKPTDIWTNHPDPQFKPPCKRGDPCHDAAPRGSRTGTQGLKNAREKARIPVALCNHIVDICEMRTCDICGKPMLDGFCIRDGMEYFCSDECLHKVYTEEEYQELYDNDQAYWTTWYDEFE